MKSQKHRFIGMILWPLLGLFALPVAWAQTDTQAREADHQIAGIVMEVRSGAPDVVVVLCDQQTGIPLSGKTNRPFTEGKVTHSSDLMTTMTSERGRFQFDHVPAGRYRLVAQKWIGPFKGVFEIQGSVIQLFGMADNVQVPSEEAGKVVLSPPGRGVLQLDQDVGNNETLLLLSTAPPEYDPILGFQCLGKPFLTGMIGANRMPYGRTTVIGLPPRPIYAFFFAGDNSPGCAVQSLKPQIENAVTKVPFVAGWSDGRHDPPENIGRIMTLLQERQLTVEELAGIKDQDRDKRRALLASQPLDRSIKLPTGESCRLGDLLAADAYRQLQKTKR